MWRRRPQGTHCVCEHSLLIPGDDFSDQQYLSHLILNEVNSSVDAQIYVPNLCWKISLKVFCKAVKLHENRMLDLSCGKKI